MIKQQQVITQIKFPYYSGNIYKTEVLGHVTLEEFCFAHMNPKPHVETIIKEIQQADATGNKQLKRTLKHKLFSFTPSVKIPIRRGRKYDNVVSFTGLMQLDFDGMDEPTALDIKQWLFEQPETITSYISPSGLGVKGLIRIKQPSDKEHYKAIFKAVQAKYEEVGYLDSSTKNAMLPLFLSIDRQMLVRDLNEAKVWVDEDWSVIQHVRLNDTQPTNFNPNENDKERTLRILRDKINGINDNGHYQVRSAALILGSRVGAGYITVTDAQQEIELLIRSNGYLKKGTSGYIATALWGISEGYKNPKYYD